MSRLKGARARLRAWLRRGAVERELDEELRWHLEMETEKYLRQGLAPEEARRRARLAFGSIERCREEHRDVRGMRQPERLWNDLRYAARGLARSKGFTLAAVLTLALGIGANAAAFGVVDALLYRPPAGVGDPDSLYRLRLSPLPPDPDVQQSWRAAWATYPEFAALRDRTRPLAEVAAYSMSTVIYGQGTEARELRALAVSDNYFTTLQADPGLGRFWSPGDEISELELGRFWSLGDAIAAGPVVVVGHDFWRRELGADPDVIGRTILASAVTLTIVGVAPAHFKGVDLDAVDLFLPINTTTGVTSREQLEARNSYWLWMVARPEPGVLPEAVATRATEVLAELVREYPGPLDSEPGQVDLIPVTDRFAGVDRISVGPTSPVPVWILGVTAVVLLIACANVSNLLLARGAGRRRELAIRAAIGASRGRIVQLLLTESLVLAALGGGAGLLLSLSSARLLRLFDLPPLDPLIDTRVLGFSLTVAMATSVLIGLLPAARLSRANVETELKAATPRATYDRSRLRAALTVAQVALSIMLLVNAGLFVRSLRNVTAIDEGFDFDRLLVVSTGFQRGTPPERVRAAQEAGIEVLRAIPGVVSAALARDAPYGRPGMQRLANESWGLPPEAIVAAVYLRVGPEYFRTLGLPLRAGRVLDRGDRAESEPVMVINETLAGMLGGENSALDRCIPQRDGCTRIVGVVADARFGDPLEEPLPATYYPLAQERVSTSSRAVLLVRTAVPPSEIAAPIRRDLMEGEPALQLVEVQSVAELLRPKLGPWRMATGIFTLFGGVAFLLATIGLYSVIAYLVAARRPEMGIRIALGASGARIRALVLAEGVRLVVTGSALGLALAFGASRLLEHRMYGVQATDPLTYTVVAILMATAALAASFISAERASRVDPNVALRSD
ncbi:MAG TPA: ABC transporter permease [Acidobacteriota bacterium]